MKYLNISALLVFVLVTVVACNDDEDIASPKVFIDRPYENQVIFAIDTIAIKARITHEVGIKWAEVELLNSEFAPVSKTQRYTVAGTDVDLNVPFLLEVPLLESGTYYIAVRAGDGNKIGSGFKRVMLHAVPRVLGRVFLATQATNNLRIFASENTGPWEQILSKSIDCRGIALNYRQNVLGIVGGEIGNLDFHETDEFNIIRSLQGLGTSSLPYFLNLTYSTDFEEFIVLMREPRLRVYDKNANPVVGFALLPDYLPSRIFAVNDLYYVSESPISQPNILLVSYSRQGIRMGVFELGGAPVGVFRRNESQVFIWENNPDGLKLRILNTTSQLISDVFQRNAEQVHDVIEISTGVFAFLGDGGLLGYNYNTGATTIINAAVTGQQLFYEKLSGTYYVANGQSLSRISPNGTVLETHDFTAEVIWVGFDYNR